MMKNAPFAVASPAKMFSTLTEHARDWAAADAQLARELIDGRAGPVSCEKIIGVDVAAFHGVVYNLQTTAGWYIANGIVTHNCRCAVGLVIA